MKGYITGYARVPIKKYINNYTYDTNLEDECYDNLSDILYTSLMEKEDEIQLEQLEFYESWE